MRDLTARQLEILLYLREFHADHGWMPTRKEISAEYGFKSVNSAHEHLKALQRKGCIEIVSGRPHILITDKGKQA